MRFFIEELEVFFPYTYIYPEQWTYMCHLKTVLDAKGPCMLEMPSGTGKTVSLLALITSYQLAHPEVGRLVYCSRTVPEIEKVLEEMKRVMAHLEESLRSDGRIMPDWLCLGLSARRKLCIHPEVREERDRVGVDSACRDLTASWVREAAIEDPTTPTCDFFEAFQRQGKDSLLRGVYTLEDLKAVGAEKGWCPYFLCRHLLDHAKVVVYSYQYLLNPKIFDKISKNFKENSIIVFDEAHNIDNVCIEGLSINLTRGAVNQASTNLANLRAQVQQAREQDEAKLRSEYERLVQGLGIADLLPQVNPALTAASSMDTTDNESVANGATTAVASQSSSGGNDCHGGRDTASVVAASSWLSDLLRHTDGLDGVEPVLAGDVVSEAVPGNIRRSTHFLALLQRFLDYVTSCIAKADSAVSETAARFLHNLYTSTLINAHTLKFLSRRLHVLMRTLCISDIQRFNAITVLADFATLIATYCKTDGFMVIIEPPDTSSGRDEGVLQFCCLDASIAMQPIFKRFQHVVITSGTLSPLRIYPRLLNFQPRLSEQLDMSLARPCLCPVIVTKGSDQVAVSSKFDLRSDPAVIRNYGNLLIDLSQVVPDGMVCFFPSYLYMETIISVWNEMGLLNSVLRTKLLFIETPDPLESTLALANYRRACDSGRGAVLFSVARGKVSEGIDFSNHYGRCVIMFGIPYVYTQSRVLRARLEFLREHYQIREAEFLTFDAMRVAAQCMGRVIRGKSDYGLMIFADKRYTRADKRNKLPQWIASHLEDHHLNLSTDMAVNVARAFLRRMAQPWHRQDQMGVSLWSEADVQAASKRATQLIQEAEQVGEQGQTPSKGPPKLRAITEPQSMDTSGNES